MQTQPNNKLFIYLVSAIMVIGVIGTIGAMHYSVLEKAEQVVVKEGEITNLDNEIVTLSTEVNTLNSEINEYKELFGTLPEETNVFKVPDIITDSATGTTFSLPVTFESGNAGTINVEILKIEKYLAEEIKGEFFVYTPTCMVEETNCNPEDSIPERVDPETGIVAIQVDIANETTSETAPISISNNFLTLIDSNKTTPYTSYISRNILTDGTLARHNRNNFSIEPLSNETLTILVQVPENSTELILTYGANLSTQYKALRFNY